ITLGDALIQKGLETGTYLKGGRSGAGGNEHSSVSDISLFCTWKPSRHIPSSAGGRGFACCCRY
ncbi:hypothetical protein NDU88_005705, partial [Pleurodeles waltl]